MKISILIPVFNYDLSNLVFSLVEEIKRKRLKDSFSIIILDDSSTLPDLSSKNLEIVQSIQDCDIRYFVARRNAGRSKSRNKLIRLARSTWILFLDADVIPDNPDFLSSYLGLAKEDEYDMICGGTSYNQRIMMNSRYDLYYDLMKYAGNASIETKNKNMWRYVLTSNIFARKVVFKKCKFDENFVTYGYEDQEWAIRASKEFRLIHLNNSVSHMGLQTREEFFSKMRVSLNNYLMIKRNHPDIFEATPISRAMKFFGFFPISFLKILDYCVAKLCYNLTLPTKIWYLFYQLDKALFITILDNTQNDYEN